MSKITASDTTPLSKLCFGCMQFGGTADASDSQAMFEASRAAGINFFDTAYAYTDGASETMLGQFAAPERDGLIIATKAAYTGGSTAQNIRTSFDISRRRLEMDSVDILYLHRWDDETPLPETFEALAGLQSEGLVRHIGVSNFAAWQVVKAQNVARSLGTRIDIIQPMYSLVKRQVEVEILPMAMSEDIAVAPYSPLGGGLLTGKYAHENSGRLVSDPRYADRYGPAWMHAAAVDLHAVAQDAGYDPATLAVAWAAHHPAVTAPIISARNVAQLEPSLAAMSVTLSDAEYHRLTALTPTPAPATDRLEEA